jgi:hypothetical protein
MVKLKYSQVKPLREQMLIEQNYLCALCNEKIVDDAVLDHCHKSGKIRRVLHRGCNSLEGKIVNNMPRSCMDLVRLKSFLSNLCKYITDDYDLIIHPTYKEKTMPGRGRGRGRKPPKR